MEQGIVQQIEGTWLGFPDVAYYKGKFFVAIRVSASHRSPTSHIEILFSNDGIHYEKLTTMSEKDGVRWNCPRLSIDKESGIMFMTVDTVTVKKITDFIKAENDPDLTSVHVFWTVDGANWREENKDLNIRGIVPDRILFYPDNNLIAAHSFAQDRLVQSVYTSRYVDADWVKNDIQSPHNLCEGSICQVKDEFVCLMRENSGKGMGAFLSRSKNGSDWSEPVETRLFGAHRPTLGKLNSGNYLVTYREQGSATGKGNGTYWARNTFAALVTEKELLSKHPIQRFVILPLDHDSGNNPDGGYAGWIQLSDDSIYVVNYITGESKKPYIKFYKFNEDEIARIPIEKNR